MKSPRRTRCTLLAVCLSVPVTVLAAVVVPPKPIPNIKPIANAGLDKTVYTRAPVELNGWASKDPDGEIAKWRWVQTLGPRVKLLGANTPTPSFVAPIIANPKAKPQKMVFALYVTDNPPKKPKQIVIPKTAVDTVAVTVKPNSAFTVTGRVIDGYLDGAHVFWDCNGDWMPNSGENVSVSGKKGVYIINQAPDPTKCDLRAYVPAGAIDEDTKKPVMDSFTMSSLPDNPNLITPLTTLANADTLIAKTKAKALAVTSNAGAGKTTAEQLGVPVGIDYISCLGNKIECTNTHNAAKLTTLAIQNQNFSYLAPENIPEALRKTTTVVASEQASYMTGKDLTATLIDSLSKNWATFTFSDLFTLVPPAELIVRPSATFEPVGSAKPVDLSEAQKSYVNDVLKIAKDQGAVNGNAVIWSKLDKKTIESIKFKTDDLFGDTQLNLDIRANYIATLNEQDKTQNELLYDAKFDATWKNPKLVSGFYKLIMNTAKGAFGAVKMAWTPGGGLLKGSKLIIANSEDYSTEKYQKVKEIVDSFLTGSVACRDFVADIADQGFLGKQIDYGPMLIHGGDCFTSAVDVDALKAIIAGAKLRKGLSDREVLKGLLDIMDFMNFLASIDKASPLGQSISGLLDMLTAGLDSYLNAIEFNEAAGEMLGKVSSQITAWHQREIDRIFDLYKLNTVRARLGGLYTVAPVILSTGLPDKTNAGNPAQFIITGINLTTSELSAKLGDADCSKVSAAIDKWVFSCPTHVTDANKNLDFQAYFGGTVKVGAPITVKIGVRLDTFQTLVNDTFDTAFNATVWKKISASKGENFVGKTTSVHDGYLDMRMDETDNGGAVVTRFAPQKKLKIEFKHNMHPGNAYFFPTIEIESGVSTYIAVLDWLRSSYQPDHCSVTANYDKIRLRTDTTASWCNSTVFSSVASSSFYDKWTTASLNYDMDTGLIEIDLDNDGTVDMQKTIPIASRKAATGVALHAFGWYAGTHSHYVDSIKINGISAQ